MMNDYEDWNHYLAVGVACFIGILLGGLIAWYHMNLYTKCMEGNLGACLILSRR